MSGHSDITSNKSPVEGDFERAGCRRMGVAGRGTSSQAPWMRGLHELSAVGDDNSIRKADGGFMLPSELSSELIYVKA